MLFREVTEELEQHNLSKRAAKVTDTKGRMREESKCSIRTDYQRDRDRILHSKAFRRLKHKTQVFLSPKGDHCTTRMTHTLEVAQISRTISRALRLNEDLTEAIALGHDLGHTPFGHSGERSLNLVHKGGFAHNEQSLRVVDVLERGKEREGLNLTFEVRDGIKNHTGDTMPTTLEGQVVKLSDRIAYINHDITDAIRAGVIKEDDLPKSALKILGQRHSQRIHTMVDNVITSSYEKDNIHMSEEVSYAMNKLRSFMFKSVYLNENAKNEEEKIHRMIQQIYQYFLAYPQKISSEMFSTINKMGTEETIKDYIAGMTDRYLVNTYLKVYVPCGWRGFSENYVF